MTTRFVPLLTVILAASLFGAAAASGQESSEESGRRAASQLNLPPPVGVKVVTLPAMSSHWVFIQDPISNVTINSISLIDGDSLRTLGMLSGGLESGFAISPDHQHLYMPDTYWSRGTRGTRIDVVSGSQFEGPIEVRVKGRRESVPLGLAKAMFVTEER